MKIMKCTELVLDFDVYPRHSIDTQNVGAMCEAEKAGAQFPPIIIDKKSKRVADGFHRLRMKQRLYGKHAEIAVQQKDYQDDAALVEDAIRLNASHGKNLSVFDRIHSILLCGRLGIEDHIVAQALSMTVDKVVELRLNKSARVGGAGVAIKRPIRHMAGKKLTKSQAEANQKLGGNSQVFYARQLIMLIQADLLENESQELLEALKELHKLLDRLLGE